MRSTHEVGAYPWPWVSYPPPWITGQTVQDLKLGEAPAAAGSAPMPPSGTLPPGWQVGWDLDNLQWVYVGPGSDLFTWAPGEPVPDAEDWASVLGSVPAVTPMTMKPKVFTSWFWPITIAALGGGLIWWYTKKKRR